jgi:hypothetical protein
MKRLKRTLGPALLISALALPLLADDIVHLRNGNRIVGTVLEGTVQGDGGVVVKIEPRGSVTLRGHDVVAIESAAAENPVGDYLAVTLKTGNSFYGDGTYFGHESSESDDTTLVLSAEKVGVIRIPRDAIAVVETVTTPPESNGAATAPEKTANEIPTEHKLHLNNGRILVGTLVGGNDDDPVRLRLGNLGVMTIPRSDVARVENAPDVYKLPAPAEEAPAGDEPADDTSSEAPTESLDALKEQIRAELMRELLDSVIEAKLQQRLEEVLGDATAVQSSVDRNLAAQLSGDEILHVEDLVRDLSRHRTISRTRAERKLVGVGSPVLPFLRGIANHPFELTRRAVQRILNDIGDVRGAPIAISVLNDPDPFVRRIAGNTLRKLLPHAAVNYLDQAPVQRRLAAQQTYQAAWNDYLRENTRLAVLEH